MKGKRETQARPLATMMTLLLVVLLPTGCRTITHRLEKNEVESNRLGLQFAHEDRISKVVDSLYSPQMPQYTELVDPVSGSTVKFVKTENVDGETMPSFSLKGVTVQAQRKSIAERMGKVSIDFIITVPKSLIDRRWQLRVYPIATKTNGETVAFQPVLLSGADFLKRQKEGYDAYKRFVASIIPDSAYWQEMLNQKGYNKALADLEAEYHAAWQKDLLLKDKWIDWEDRLNRRYRIFNNKVKRNRLSVDEGDWRLTFLPEYWLLRDINKSVVPRVFAEFAFGNKAIVKKHVSAEDSMRIEKKYWDFQKMAENERKKEEQEAMKNKLIKFPQIPARLDSIVETKSDWQYMYTQELTADKHTKRIALVLDGEVVAIDQSRYQVPSSDTLIYNISAMVDFIDEAPRYKRQIVYRQVDKDEKAYIEFPQGGSQVDPSFAKNEEELARVRDVADEITRTGELVLDSISMTAYASPEGNASFNHRLAQRRVDGLKEYIVRTKMLPGIKPSSIRTRSVGENWDGLKEWLLVEVPDSLLRDRVLTLINTTSDLDAREARIRSEHPSLYTRLKEEAYPSLRSIDFRFYTHRKDMVQDTIHTTVIDDRYNEGRELLRARDYKGALAILHDYPNDFNHAICLMSLGYDKAALSILKNHTDLRSGDVQYLLSILEYRSGNIQKALSHLMAAVKADKRKVFRAQLDPELNKLIKEYNLFSDILDF